MDITSAFVNKEKSWYNAAIMPIAEPLRVSWVPNDLRLSSDRRHLSDPGAMNIPQSNLIVNELLTRGFVEETLSSRDPSYRGGSVDSVFVDPFTEGLKNFIFLIHVRGRQRLLQPFILVLSKGNDNLNNEVRTDYRDLKDISVQLDERRLTRFVPRPYVLGEARGFPGFSVEYLPNHYEMVCANAPELEEVFNMQFAALMMNPTRPSTLLDSLNGGTELWNNKMARNYLIMIGKARQARTAALADESIRRSTFYTTEDRIKLEMIARLYMLNQLTGSVSSQFRVNAGDFMIKLTDFDLRLITVRGGLTPKDEVQFRDWLLNFQEHTVNANPELERHFLLFDGNEELIKKGIDKGRQLMSSRVR